MATELLFLHQQEVGVTLCVNHTTCVCTSLCGSVQSSSRCFQAANHIIPHLIGYTHTYAHLCIHIYPIQTEEGGAMESDSEQSDEYRPSDMSDDVGSEEDSDEDYSSLAEDESESGEENTG